MPIGRPFRPAFQTICIHTYAGLLRRTERPHKKRGVMTRDTGFCLNPFVTLALNEWHAPFNRAANRRVRTVRCYGKLGDRKRRGEHTKMLSFAHPILRRRSRKAIASVLLCA